MSTTYNTDMSLVPRDTQTSMVTTRTAADTRLDTVPLPTDRSDGFLPSVWPGPDERPEATDEDQGFSIATRRELPGGLQMSVLYSFNQPMDIIGMLSALDRAETTRYGKDDLETLKFATNIDWADFTGLDADGRTGPMKIAFKRGKSTFARPSNVIDDMMSAFMNMGPTRLPRWDTRPRKISDLLSEALGPSIMLEPIGLGRDQQTDPLTTETPTANTLGACTVQVGEMNIPADIFSRIGKEWERRNAGNQTKSTYGAPQAMGTGHSSVPPAITQGSTPSLISAY